MAVTCPECNGTGTIPAGGGEPPEDVDNGYVRCPKCSGPRPEFSTVVLTVEQVFDDAHLAEIVDAINDLAYVSNIRITERGTA